jgi:GNAT superfamily N-acetyltransferase
MTIGLAVEVGRLAPSKAACYADLTFPSYREALFDGVETIAVLASAGANPAGLALARTDGTVLSVAVKPAYRRQAIGRALLDRLEGELAARGCRFATCTYMTGLPSTEAIEILLRRQGWEGPVPRMLVCRGSVSAVKTAAWMKNPPPLNGAMIVPWIDIPPRERDDFEPDAPDHFEPANSVGLRLDGSLAGCVLTHRIAKNLLRYTKLSLLHGLEKSGLGLALLAASIHHHPANTPGADEIGIWDVRMDNRLMLNFVRRRLQPYLTHVARTMGSRKQLLS